MWCLLFLDFIKLFFQLLLDVPLFDVNDGFLLFLLLVLFNLLVLKDVLKLVRLFQTLNCGDLLFALCSVYLLGWLLIGACWSVFLLLLFNVLRLVLLFLILLFSWVVIVFLFCLFAHRFCLVYDIEVWTDEIVDRQLVDVLLWSRLLGSLLLCIFKDQNILLVL